MEVLSGIAFGIAFYATLAMVVICLEAWVQAGYGKCKEADKNMGTVYKAGKFAALWWIVVILAKIGDKIIDKL